MINIAIDGPSGAGKSTIAKIVAKELGITYLDTGAMYRAVALHIVNSGKNPSREEDVLPLLGEIKISYIKNGEDNLICLNGKDVSTDIRRHEMSKYASEVSKIPQVRKFLVDMQRKIAQSADVVLDGRDITSYVLPDAKYKFYLTADAEERAKRRFKELQEKGQDVPYEQILKDILDRDYNDMNRDFAPLVKTDDSIEIDSTSMTPQEVADVILKNVRQENNMQVAVKQEKELIDLKDVNASFNKKIKQRRKNNRPNIFYRGLACFLRWIMGAVWTTRIYFADRFPKNVKAIAICNHYSALDPCVIISKLLGKNGKILMKNEVTNNNFVANVTKALGGIPVKRGEADVNAVKSILGALNKNQPVLIFPEGTRNREGGKEMLPFKSGVATFAIKSKSPIVPILYYKKTGIFKRNKMIVGTPFWLDKFYDKKIGDVKEEATEYIYQKMQELRVELDILVEKCHGSKKKYLKYKKNQSMELCGNVGEGRKK